jgi:hypothetical protein
VHEDHALGLFAHSAKNSFHTLYEIFRSSLSEIQTLMMD